MTEEEPNATRAEMIRRFLSDAKVIFPPGQPAAETPVEKEPTARVPDQAPSDDCKHLWKIATPNGPTSQGVCENCGGTHDFRNSEGPGFNTRSAKGSSPHAWRRSGVSREEPEEIEDSPFSPGIDNSSFLP